MRNMKWSSFRPAVPKQHSGTAAFTCHPLTNRALQLSDRPTNRAVHAVMSEAVRILKLIHPNYWYNLKEKKVKGHWSPNDI